MSILIWCGFDWIHIITAYCNQTYKKPFYKNTNVKIQKFQKQCSYREILWVFLSWNFDKNVAGPEKNDMSIEKLIELD